MRFIYIYINGVTRMNFWVGKWTSRVLLVIFALLILEVAFRHFAGAPKVWTNELAQLLFGVYAVLSGGHILARHGHVNVDIFYNRLSPQRKAVVDIFTSILFFIFIIALLYFGSSLAYESMSFWERSQSAWDPPIWPVKLAIPIGATLILLQGIAKLLDDVLAALGLPSAMPLANRGTDHEH